MQQLVFFISNQLFFNMFRASLRPSSGGRIAFHCLCFSVLFIVVVMLLSRVAKCVHCDEDVAWRQATSSSQCTHLTTRMPSITTTINRTENYRQWNAVRPPDDARKDDRSMVRINWLRKNHYLLHLIGLTVIYLWKQKFSRRSRKYFPRPHDAWRPKRRQHVYVCLQHHNNYNRTENHRQWNAADILTMGLKTLETRWGITDY
jgi:hypothetical protein